MKKLRQIAKKVGLINKVIGPLYRAWRDGGRVTLLQWHPQYNERGLITLAACPFMSDPKYIAARNTAIKESGQDLPLWGGIGERTPLFGRQDTASNLTEIL